MFKKNGCSWIGVLLGGIALLLVITHFMAGPFAPRPSLESVVATKALNVLKGKALAEEVKSAAWDIDRLISAATGLLAAGAVILGMAGWARKEEKRVVSAVTVGLMTIAFQPALAIVGVVILVALIAGILQSLLGCPLDMGDSAMADQKMERPLPILR